MPVESPKPKPIKFIYNAEEEDDFNNDFDGFND